MSVYTYIRVKKSPQHQGGKNMTVTIIKKEDATIKNIRKAMRSAESWHETILIEGWGQIKKTGRTGYSIGPLPEDDDSDPMTDYSAWSYCWKEKWVLDDIKRNLNIA